MVRHQSDLGSNMKTETIDPIKAKEQRFRNLAETWKRETLYLSGVSKKAMHPAYQGIIGLGDDAIPWILEDLKKAPADWFWALTAITGENPIPETSEGNVEKMAEAWVNGCRTRGY
jgi:hypothetical protein